MSGLAIPKRILGVLVAQAKAAAPVEACGILAGRDGRVETFHPMTNADRSTDHFTMEPREQFAVAKAIRAAEQEMLAVYHSHPASPARPSPEDMRLAVTPGVVYVILSLQQKERPALKGFLIEGSVVTETPVTIVVEEERTGREQA
jgi:proteasome lid subunit RPN8/RPN11